MRFLLLRVTRGRLDGGCREPVRPLELEQRGERPAADGEPADEALCSERRGVKPCVVALGAAQTEEVSFEPSPPVSTRHK